MTPAHAPAGPIPEQPRLLPGTAVARRDAQHLQVGLDEAAVLRWSTAVEDGRRHRYCETCSREHLRSMEGKLAPEHW